MGNQGGSGSTARSCTNTSEQGLTREGGLKRGERGSKKNAAGGTGKGNCRQFDFVILCNEEGRKKGLGSCKRSRTAKWKTVKQRNVRTKFCLIVEGVIR